MNSQTPLTDEVDFHVPSRRGIQYELMRAHVRKLEAQLSSFHGEILRVTASLYAAQDRAVRAEAVLRQIIKGVNDPQFTAANYFGGYDKLCDKLINEWKEV